jgi:DNA-directed RNA polymerase specialized sigma24 family protein
MEEPVMGFYYAAERKRFEQEWDKLRKEYMTAGMPAEAIQVLYDFDLDFFRSQRIYETHTQPVPSEYIGEDESELSTLFRKFENCVVCFDEADFFDRYAWIDTIEDPQLLSLLRQLKNHDLELLTFLVLEGHSQCELAEKWGCSQKAVSKRFRRLKNFFKNFLK